MKTIVPDSERAETMQTTVKEEENNMCDTNEYKRTTRTQL